MRERKSMTKGWEDAREARARRVARRRTALPKGKCALTGMACAEERWCEYGSSAVRVGEGPPIEVSELHDGKLYNPSVRAIAERLQGVRLLDDIETREATFLSQARRFKRNDGRIDDIERQKMDRTAKELGIDAAREIVLLEKVESEFEAHWEPTDLGGGKSGGAQRGFPYESGERQDGGGGVSGGWNPARGASPEQCAKCGRWRPLTEMFECQRC